jgi:hypothetical protein
VPVKVLLLLPYQFLVWKDAILEMADASSAGVKEASSASCCAQKAMTS